MTDTEWTSISVTEAQKQRLKAAKPESASMGAWLVSQVERAQDADIDSDELIALLETANEPGDTIERDELITELKKTQELIESVPERTAQTVGEQWG